VTKKYRSERKGRRSLDPWGDGVEYVAKSVIATEETRTRHGERYLMGTGAATFAWIAWARKANSSASLSRFMACSKAE
jgi:hypothetical protein